MENITTTTILITVNVIASMYAWNNRDVYYKWMMNPYQTFHHKQYHRFLTSGFIHVDTMHLLFNMLTLYFFGDVVELIIARMYGGMQAGRLIFIGFYLIGIVVSEIPTFFKNRNQPNYNSLGASGAVSAVIFVYILYFPLNKLYIFGVLPIPGFVLGILYIWYSIQMGRRKVGNINHDAHLYGALYGILFSIVSYPQVLMEFLEQLKNFTLF
jgi:membrane associated rhomboid family serine protease